MRVLRKVKLKVKQQGKLKGNNFINFPTPPQKLIVIPDGIWDPKIIILDFVIIGRGVGLGGGDGTRMSGGVGLGLGRKFLEGSGFWEGGWTASVGTVIVPPPTVTRSRVYCILIICTSKEARLDRGREKALQGKASAGQALTSIATLLLLSVFNF